MKKTKLVPITSLDQLEVGSVIVDEDGRKYKVLVKCGLVIWKSYPNTFTEAYSGAFTLEQLQELDYQLEVTEEPWQPALNEKYFTPAVNSGTARASEISWNFSSVDIALFLAGFVCKTKEEAVLKSQKMLDSIKDSE